MAVPQTKGHEENKHTGMQEKIMWEDALSDGKWNIKGKRVSRVHTTEKHVGRE